MVEAPPLATGRNGRGNSSAAGGAMRAATELVSRQLVEVEANLRDFDDLKPDTLRRAVEIIVSSGGKRIRPMVTLLVAGLFGHHDDERVIHVASAIEMLHTATLVHDDLIDGSLMRRGAATLNAAWTPAATVLTGDYLFAHAAGLAARANNVRVMSIFADTLGVIVGGELQQQFSDWAQRSTREDYFRRIYAKTASMFVLAAMSAGVVSNAPESDIDALRAFGHHLGMAFQIVDDILDFTGEQVSVGKPVGSDLRRGLITLPTICYLEQHADDPLLASALRGECAAEQCDALIARIRESEAIGRAFDEATHVGAQAADALRRFGSNAFADALHGLIEYTVARRL